MKLAEVSVNRPVFAIMMTAALIVLGAVSYESLGLDLMPKTDAPVVSVQANLPGASAEEIETQITKRIEEAVNTISAAVIMIANTGRRTLTSASFMAAAPIRGGPRGCRRSPRRRRPPRRAP